MSLYITYFYIYIYIIYIYIDHFPGGSAVKNLPANEESQEMLIRPLGQKDPLEYEMATHSSIVAWRIPGNGQSSLAGYSPWGHKELDTI